MIERLIQQSIEVGPVHEFLPGVMKLGIGLNGDEIETVDVEFGYLSKNLLKNALGKFILDEQIKLSRIDPESSPIIDSLISSCVEQITESAISHRAAWIRKIVCEVSDLSSALKYLAQMSKRMKIDALTQVILRHREDLLDLLELLTGSRFGYDFVIPGGVRFDLSHGFSERLEKWIKNFKEDHARIESMFYWIKYHRNFLRKIGGVIDTGSLGFITKSKKEETRLGPVSNVETRISHILDQTLQICSGLLSSINETTPGDHKVKLNLEVKKNEGESEIETSRGDWRFKLELTSKLMIKNIEVSTPSDQTVICLAEALINENLNDLPLILQSLNFSVAEVDK